MKYLKAFKALTLSVALTAMSATWMPVESFAKSKFCFCQFLSLRHS